MHCPHCGNDVKVGWRYCPKCAKPLPDENGNIPDVAPIPPSQPSEDTKPGNVSKFISGLIGICIIFFFVSSCDSSNAYYSTSTPGVARTSQPVKTDPRDSLRIQEGWTWEVDRYGYGYINGSVEHIGQKPIRYFKITAEYLDDNGKVLDTAYTNSGERVNPGNQKRFKIMHKHSPDFKKARIFVDQVNFE